MPGMNGPAVARRLRAKGSVVPILMLTARDAVPDRVEGLEAGADDYLVKPFETVELVARIRALLRRGQVVRVVSHGDLQVDPDALVAVRGGRRIELTPREAELLALLVRSAGRVVSRAEALAEVWPTAPAHRERGRPAHHLPAGQAGQATADPDGARRRLRGAPVRRWKLRTQIAVAAAVSILLGVVVLGVALQLLLARDLRSQLDRTLRQRAADVATLSATTPALLTAPGALDSSATSGAILIQVSTATIASTPARNRWERVSCRPPRSSGR